jgi:glycyl-tRNA synthetase
MRVGFWARSARRSLSTSAEAGIKDLREMCKNRGFIFPGSEVYGGLTGSFDYGPLGSQLKKNIKDLWWRHFVTRRRECVGLDSSIILHSKVWEAAGHIEQFIDPLCECKVCHTRFRTDKLIEEAGGQVPKNNSKTPQDKQHWLSEMSDFVAQRGLKCKVCGNSDFTPTREFNLLFETNYGGQATYLRPETAQGVYINFPQLLFCQRGRLPLGVGQIGKSFRNEISPGNFIFRQREFEQMELQYFCHPDAAMGFYHYWIEECKNWLINLGLPVESIRLHEYAPTELAHYAKATTDIQFKFLHGWDELWGIAHRGNFDLSTHAKASDKPKKFEVEDPMNKQTFIPNVVEPAVGTAPNPFTKGST